MPSPSNTSLVPSFLGRLEMPRPMGLDPDPLPGPCKDDEDKAVDAGGEGGRRSGSCSGEKMPMSESGS
jgi:hypothetical protein